MAKVKTVCQTCKHWKQDKEPHKPPKPMLAYGDCSGYREVYKTTFRRQAKETCCLFSNETLVIVIE